MTGNNWANNPGEGSFPIWAGGNPNGRMCGDVWGLSSTFRVVDTNFPINYGITSGGTGWGVDRSILCFGSRHSGGANFLMMDGTVRFISDSINTTIYAGLGTVAGGEVVPGNF